MRTFRLDEMFKGWFVGNFEPTVLRTDAVEVAIKHYPAGEQEARHHHRIAQELTAIVSGRVRMNGCVYGPGDIVLVDRFESTDFQALEDSCTVVVKLPGASNDKYLGEASC